MNWAAVVSGALCAIGSGYAFGSSTPSWENDAGIDGYLEPGGRYGGLGGSSYYGYGGNAYLAGCLAQGLRGQGAAALLLVAALVLMYGYSGLSSNEGLGEEGSGFLLLFDRRSWALVVSLAIGYICAVARDRGPVGPLQ